MFPHTEDTTSASGAAPTISVTVTALTRPTSLGTTDSPIPSPPNSSAYAPPILDTPTITNLVLSALEGVQSGVPTRTTPTLTPTTLRNIEDLFDAHGGQAPEVHFNQAGFVPPLVQPTTASTYVSVDSKAWGGGVTTLTQPPSVSPAPSSRPPSTASSAQTLSPSHSPMPALNASSVGSQPTQTGRRTGGRRPLKDEKLSPEEEERRLLRRERNKQAAARCRKRRMDQTNRLQDETEVLEDKRDSLQQEIQLLQQQRDELEFLLAAHKTTCKRGVANGRAPPSGGVANGRAPPSGGVANNGSSGSVFSAVEIKEEPMEIHYEDVAPGPPASAGRPSHNKPPRPTSLNLSGGNRLSIHGGLTDLGISIETPSNELRGLGLNFESMMESGTGLTPVSGVGGPVPTGLTPLTTPVVTTAPSSNCGTQQRSSSAGELSSPDSVPPKLVSL